MTPFGAFRSHSALATTNAFSPVSGSKGMRAMWFGSSSSMSTPPLQLSVRVGARKRVLSLMEK